MRTDSSSACAVTRSAVFAGRLALAAACLFLACGLVAQDEAPERTAFCHAVDQPPTIDGDLGDTCWRSADVQSGFFVLNRLYLARENTDVMCVTHGDAMYVAFRCHTRRLDGMRTLATERDSLVWQDDCAEVFIVPPDGIWYRVTVNSAGVVYDTRSDTQPTEWDPDVEVACGKHPEGEGGPYWAAEMRIPFAVLNSRPDSGGEWHINFARTETQSGEWTTWSAIETGGFEQPQFFDRLVFRAPTEQEVAKRQAQLEPFLARSTGDTQPMHSIPLPVGELTAIKKLPVEDCRVVRAFVGAPVDGCTRSLQYVGSVTEYPTPGVGPGVDYTYNSNDGLHITLGDDAGFDAVVLRGGAQADMYVGTGSLKAPEEAAPLWRFAGSEDAEVAYFAERVQVTRISLFHTRGGTIADLAFYRLSTGATDLGEGEAWAVTGDEAPLPEPTSEFAPESLYFGMQERYGEGERQALQLRTTDARGSEVRLAEGRAVHFITDPFAEERGLAAVGLEGTLNPVSDATALELTVQDPLNPRRDIASVTVRVPDNGRLQLILDTPDQVLLPGSRVWVTLRANADCALQGPQRGAPQFRLHFIPRAQALPEALAWRQLLLRTVFQPLSEPRPWGGFRGQAREEFFASSRYARECPELFMTIDQCHALDPSDDLTRQYREWVYAGSLDQVSEVDPPPPPPEGVPDWAWYPRLAWLEFRRMAQWWMDERLVPTGEVGVRVQDDSDFYQQFADLALFERDGVAGTVMDACARLAELADQTTLREGLNIQATDSLHAYEEGINHLALMARWHYGDPIYLERCMESARSVEKLTVVTEDGRRHFRDGDRMGYQDLATPREPAVDGHSNPLMWHAALQFADYNRHPKVLALLREWADTWLRFQEPGQWATSVEVLSGKVLSSEENRPLTGGYMSQAVTFLWLYALTGDSRYVEPFLHYARRGEAVYPLNVLSGDLCSLGAMDEVDDAAKARLADACPGAALYVAGDPGSLVVATIGNPRSARAYIDNLCDARRFPDMYTTTHQYTDRVFLGSLQVHPSVAYLGGYCKRNKYNPTQAVSWEGLGTDYAALVLRNRHDGLKVAVYNFASQESTGRMRVWSLDHGRYNVTVGADDDGDFGIDRVHADAGRELVRADAIDLSLPPQAVTVIEVVQERELDPIFERADLAIAAREVEVKDGSLTGTVHNVGCANVGDVVVAVLDAEGGPVARTSLGPLQAPLDLVAKRIGFTLQLPATSSEGRRLVVDPGDEVPEIYEGNNAVALDDLPAVDYRKGWE